MDMTRRIVPLLVGIGLFAGAAFAQTVDLNPTTPDGEEALGGAYLTGHGVPQDRRKGLEWLERAVGHGSTHAMDDLGYLYSV